MDDLGAEQLSKLSCNPKKNCDGKIFDSTQTPLPDKDTKISAFNANESERNANSGLVQATSVAGNNVESGAQGSPTVDEDAPDDEKEKTDATPENLKKIDDVIAAGKCVTDGIPSPPSVGMTAASGELRIVEDESPSPSKQQQALAFTIDFGQGAADSASAVTSQKYRNMVERFQNRHKRGASMSKIEDQSAPTTPVSGRASRTGSAQSTRQSRQSSETTSEATKVKMRIRDRSTSGVRDANKRHSWSPRSSTHEANESQKQTKQMEPIRPVRQIIRPTPTKTTPNDDRTANNFIPRSTAMQLALNKVEFVCPQPPLDDFEKQKKLEDDDESISEAGTYTVDGDNYTEEQKELMNIDKARTAELQRLLAESGQSRPTNLPLLSSTIESRRQNNVLEISYYHDSTSLKPKISYLEKIKSRVKSITKSPDKQALSPSDLGTFTSVTTSGVLSKKTSLDPHPKVHRKNSLTKSHIDSSEYVSTEGGGLLRSVVGRPNYPNTFTDHQKAEYKLNVFSNQTDSQILSEHYSCDTTPLHTPESPPDLTALTDTGLKTAQSKNDWIQEWARNARARSATTKTSNNGTVVEQMSRSFNFENTEDSMLSDPIAYHNKPIDRYRNHTIGDFEYSSDTNLSGRKILPVYDYQSNNGSVTARPPLSPSKIPSPVHTVGRTRNAPNRTRGSLQDLSPNAFSPETDIYLQKTAAAISNLAQSLSRKNSLQSSKSPSSNTNSPCRGVPYQHHQPHHHHHRYQSQPQQHHYSADEYSPTHQNPSQNLHKRHLSHDYRTNLMSHSLNSEQLNGMLDYRNKQQRERQNSFDATLYSPRRMYPPVPHQAHIIEQTNSSIKQQQQNQHHQSPLRRSSSFSSKPQQMPVSKRNQSQAQQKATQSRPPITNSKGPSIQKSASSTSFRKMYSDYDDNIEYYINDEDDLVQDYCSSDEYDEPNEYYQPEKPIEPEPLTNTRTRYNKALLMRIERSKQKVAGNLSSSSQNKPLSGGVMACPNTPEMPRRSAQAATRSSMRQSVPRDSSLNRLRGEVPNSLASAKKQLLQTATTQNAAASRKIQPKYMDISKYKSGQGGNFLRKDESKSTLAASRTEIKRSPSSASVVLNRNDPVRASNRSVKSAGGKPSSGASGAIGGTVPKQKENELAMWRRRATYDPMKAAAEGRRKQEEAKKITNVQTKVGDSFSSSVVLRSQSFHSGVGQLSGNRNYHRMPGGGVGGSNDLGNNSINSNEDDHSNYRWTLTSNESSDECDDDYNLHRNK